MICEPPKAFSVRILSPIELARAAPDAIILHQPLDDPQTDALEAYARFLPQVRRIITIDDLITALPKKNSFYKPASRTPARACAAPSAWPTGWWSAPARWPTSAPT
jgi:hypothetical protein